MDALGPKADEGRGKAALSLDEPSNGHSRGYPNGETLSGVESDNPSYVGRRASGGTETSKSVSYTHLTLPTILLV